MSHYTDLRDVAHALGRCYEAEGHDCSPAGIEDLLARVERDMVRDFARSVLAEPLVDLETMRPLWAEGADR